MCGDGRTTVAEVTLDEREAGGAADDWLDCENHRRVQGSQRGQDLLPEMLPAQKGEASAKAREHDMNKKKLAVAFLTGGGFGVAIFLVTGFAMATWQFWVLLLAGASTKLTELFD